MNRPLLLAAAAALLVLTGCGTVQTGAGAAPAPDTSRSAQAEQARKDAAERYRQALAEHDRRYPLVAQACATATDATPSAAGSPALDPEAAKHAENNFFKQTLPLSDTAKCRGEAHVARITAALARGRNGAQTQQALENLGYPADTIKVTAHDNGPAGFVLEVPGAGPCIEGTAYQGGRLEVEAHGYYQEGGCAMPKNGH
ncbi:hypothetical protein AB0O91_38100 [Kitasatospora sp. NPDC089797]|uniref:hypothetical protein n=1 Tax=Kitasatospora sp. NPDC089797 TaxID=3155298 RepID=UPI003432C857